jgi:hypothetical protein
MRTPTVGVTAIIAAVTLLLAPATQAGPQGQTQLSAKLNGAAVVPGPGDSDGSALVELRLFPGKKEICTGYTYDGFTLEDPEIGHLHRGREGVKGPVVVTLFDFLTPGSKRLCVKAKPSLLKDLKRHPHRFYVDFHTPDGAVRGQLSKKAAGI